MKKTRVLILGKTGTGKSTLINSILKESAAETGIGKPITSSILYYDGPCGLTLYDSPGIELGYDDAAGELLSCVDACKKKRPVQGTLYNPINVIWYCISSTGHRLENTEIQFLHRLAEDARFNIPVLIVLTQSFARKDVTELRRSIENESLPINGIVAVLSQDYEIDEGRVVSAFGLDELIEKTFRCCHSKPHTNQYSRS